MNEDRHLEAMRGYLFLEMPEDAIEELKFIPSDSMGHREVLDLKLASEMMAERWNEAIESAMELCRRFPRGSSYFIHAAYCLHEVGDTFQAKKVLLSGPKELLDEALFHYNMACYLAVLGNSIQAEHYLKTAIELDGALKKTALEDADLAGITLK